MTERKLLVEKIKLEALMTELDIEMLYIKEEKYNIQKEIDAIDRELSDLITPIL